MVQQLSSCHPVFTRFRLPAELLILNQPQQPIGRTIGILDLLDQNTPAVVGEDGASSFFDGLT